LLIGSKNIIGIKKYSGRGKEGRKEGRTDGRKEGRKEGESGISGHWTLVESGSPTIST
jgi:predicted transposase YdaD